MGIANQFNKSRIDMESTLHQKASGTPSKRKSTFNQKCDDREDTNSVIVATNDALENLKVQDRVKGKNSPLNLRAQDIKEVINSPNYSAKKLMNEEAKKTRKQSSICNNMFKNFVTNTVSIMGIAVKEGQKLTGVELSPALFRKAGLLSALRDLGWDCRDVGDITTEDLEPKIKAALADTKRYKYDVENSHVIGPMCEELSDMVYQGALRSDFNLILGGDHGLAAGSISGMLRKYPDLKVVWIDAHGDCNTPETSPSGNYHGMPVAHLLGWMEKGDVKGFDWLDPVPVLKGENIVYIGLRDVDKEEKALLKKHNIKCYSPFDIEMKGGIGNVMTETLAYLKGEEGMETPIHCSWDVDGCDPSFMTGTGTRARAGLTLRESHFILQRLFNTGNLVSLDMVEVNTLLEKGGDDREVLHGDLPTLRGKETIVYACELILSAMGFSWL